MKNSITFLEYISAKLIRYTNGSTTSGDSGVDSILNRDGLAVNSVTGIICPLGLNRVNWSAKFRGGGGFGPTRPPSSYTSKENKAGWNYSIIYKVNYFSACKLYLTSPYQIQYTFSIANCTELYKMYLARQVGKLT